MSLIAMRRRLPPVVFILFLIVLLVMLGVACACISDHPGQKVDRAGGAVPAAGIPVLEIWPVAVAIMAGSLVLLWPRRLVRGSSPAALQRFLF